MVGPHPVLTDGAINYQSFGPPDFKLDKAQLDEIAANDYNARLSGKHIKRHKGMKIVRAYFFRSSSLLITHDSSLSS
jgi:hypothetical protein